MLPEPIAELHEPSLPYGQLNGQEKLANLSMVTIRGPCQLGKMKLRLKEWREARGLTQEELSEISGLSESYLSRLESGKRRANSQILTTLSQSLQVRAVDLIEDTGTAPVVGYVGGGQTIYPIDDHAQGNGLYMVACPRGLDPETTVAVEVRGDSMSPIEDGWILFYGQHPERGVPPDCLGKLCVVQVDDDGPMYVKILKPGRENGTYDLYSSDRTAIYGQRVKWAARVLLTGPRDVFLVDA